MGLKRSNFIDNAPPPEETESPPKVAKGKDRKKNIWVKETMQFQESLRADIQKFMDQECMGFSTAVRLLCIEALKARGIIK